jgi:hypothetical protein
VCPIASVILSTLIRVVRATSRHEPVQVHLRSQIAPVPHPLAFLLANGWDTTNPNRRPPQKTTSDFADNYLQLAHNHSMTALYPKSEKIRRSQGNQALATANSFILSSLKVTSILRVLYRIRTKNAAKQATNSFAEKTLGCRLEWNEDFTEDPPLLSPSGRGRWPQVRTSPRGRGVPLCGHPSVRCFLAPQPLGQRPLQLVDPLSRHR